MDDMPIVTDELVNSINSSNLNWTASSEWAGNMTVAQARSLLGTIQAPLTAKKAHWGSLLKYTSVPDSFDSRTEWPNCVHAIRDQQQCGSCWAFGATEALSDRYCIQKGINVVLSPEYLVDCDNDNYGCNGGYLQLAWDFMQNTGVVDDTCDPYTAGDGQSSQCISSCKDSEAMKVYRSTAAESFSDPTSIKMAIMKGGPVETAFSVYQDFFAYSSGIYKYDGTSAYAGGHAVKIVGWGVQSGTDYWIVANSWGTGWGESGFFNIAFGQCGIDSDAIAGDAQ
jgi:cathepsin B